MNELAGTMGTNLLIFPASTGLSLTNLEQNQGASLCFIAKKEETTLNSLFFRPLLLA